MKLSLLILFLCGGVEKLLPLPEGIKCYPESVYDIIPKRQIIDWTEYSEYKEMLMKNLIGCYPNFVDNKKEATEALNRFKDYPHPDFEVKLSSGLDGIGYSPINPHHFVLDWDSASARPELDQTTLLHDPRLIPHMIPLMQTMSDALPQLGLGEITEAKYKRLVDAHLTRFNLKTDLGYGMIHVIQEENRFPYLLRNPSISNQGFREVILNGKPTRIKHKISGKPDEGAVFTKTYDDREINSAIVSYYRQFAQETFEDLLDDYGDFRFIDFESQLERNPELLAKYVFAAGQVGRRNINCEGNDHKITKMHLISMLPSFSNFEPCENLFYLSMHPRSRKSDIPGQFVINRPTTLAMILGVKRALMYKKCNC